MYFYCWEEQKKFTLHRIYRKECTTYMSHALQGRAGNEVPRSQEEFHGGGSREGNDDTSTKSTYEKFPRTYRNDNNFAGIKCYKYISATCVNTCENSPIEALSNYWILASGSESIFRNAEPNVIQSHLNFHSTLLRAIVRSMRIFSQTRIRFPVKRTGGFQKLHN